MNQNVQRKRDLRHLNPHTEPQGKVQEHQGEEASGEVRHIDGLGTKSGFFFLKAGSVLFDFHESSSFLPVGGNVAFP